MATALDDLPNQAVLGLTLPPGVHTGTVLGTAVDLSAGDGRGFAILVCGAAPAQPVSAWAQTSADGDEWEDAAVFPAIPAAGVYAVGFDRPTRFARVAVLTPAGLLAAAVVGQQRKHL